MIKEAALERFKYWEQMELYILFYQKPKKKKELSSKGIPAPGIKS